MYWRPHYNLGKFTIHSYRKNIWSQNIAFHHQKKMNIKNHPISAIRDHFWNVYSDGIIIWYTNQAYNFAMVFTMLTLGFQITCPAAVTRSRPPYKTVRYPMHVHWCVIFEIWPLVFVCPFLQLCAIGWLTQCHSDVPPTHRVVTTWFDSIVTVRDVWEVNSRAGISSWIVATLLLWKFIHCKNI